MFLTMGSSLNLAQNKITRQEENMTCYYYFG
jgi:hypothetical protein